MGAWHGATLEPFDIYIESSEGKPRGSCAVVKKLDKLHQAVKMKHISDHACNV